MSQENVELFRSQIEGFLAATGGLGGQDMLKLVGVYHPEIEFDASEVPMPDIAGVYRGRIA